YPSPTDMKSTCFFFSSRRRHTRSKRDWSSDVCSSDLRGRDHSLGRCSPQGRSVSLTTLFGKGREAHLAEQSLPARTTEEEALGRSEERRVGKEGRARWRKHR